jgi:hypothetical protein
MTAVLFFVDVEAPKDAHAPCEGHMTEFGIIHYDSYESFHGRDDSLETMVRMHVWIVEKAAGGRPVFVSDNPAYDWQRNLQLFATSPEHTRYHRELRIGYREKERKVIT